MNSKEKGRKLLKDFKGDNYDFGIGILENIGKYAAEYGEKVLLIASSRQVTDKVKKSLANYKLKLVGNRVVANAAPNAPREDVYRLMGNILYFKPDSIVVVGGGSAIDAAKAANVLATTAHYSADIESYFGTDKVTEALKHSENHLIPLIAVQTAASSAAHLTKYSNVTDPVEGQKKLIVDDAIIPDKAVFDYSTSKTMPGNLTVDGIFDGISHNLEVFYGIDEERYELVADICETALRLIVEHTPKIIEDPENIDSREALGIATDLGGYSIMVGGTNGGHLTSFSLVDVSSHGRASGLMNIYYTIFFAPAVEKQLQVVGKVFKDFGYISAELENLSGRELGIAVAEGMTNFAEEIGFPTHLSQLDGFTDQHINRALEAAKNPQLEMKLKNMPIPLDAGLVDEYMKPILEAAKTGDFSLIKNLK